LQSARFTAPTSAIVVNDTVVIADAGNRRLRQLPLESLRGPLGSHFEDIGSTSDYRIALISNSFGFLHAEWANSIPGELESNLNQDRSRIGLTKPIRVSMVRIDGGTVTGTAAYIDNFFSSGQFDMVILLLNQYHLRSERAALGDKVLGDAEFSALDKALKAANLSLTKAGVPFLVAITPVHESMSPLIYVDGEANYDMGPGRDYDRAWRDDLRMQEVVQNSGVPFVSFFDGFEASEQSDSPEQLFDTLDLHFAPAGNALVATLLTQYLEANRPWMRSGRR
jgi:hypothetical protein